MTAVDATIDVGGARLAYTLAGHGDPHVLLLHGMACDRSQFGRQLRHLAPAHRVVSLDLRGHGDSDKPHGDYSTEVLVEDIRRVITNLGLNRPVVVGHSRGGSLALALAMAHPRLTRALVLLDSGIRPPDDRQRDLAPFYATLGGPDHAERVRRFAATALLENTDGAEVAARVEAAMAATPGHVFQAMAASVMTFDNLAAAQQCPVPGLLILAARPAFLGAGVLDTLPDSWQIARVVGSGHFVHLVVPDQVNAMIDRFLELLPEVAIDPT
jgi:pimeloyl-ACP methyl ester carboxylesterase